MAKRKICLDAGHYGKYNRSPVVPEYYESDMNWKLHLYLKAELEGYGFEVITTRKEQGPDLGLYQRGYAAKGCDLFLSLHSNACNTESVDRVVVIALLDDKKYDFDDVSRKIGDKLGKVIKDTMGVNEYRVITKKSDNDRDGNGIFDDEYYGVLNGAKAARVPGLILEHSFHTNTKATKWLLNNENLKLMAKNEAKCIAEYFGVNKEETKTETINPMNYTDAEFIEIIAKNVNKIRKEFGIEVASPVIAQACLESGYGKSNKAKRYNFFGMKYREGRLTCHNGTFMDGSSEQLADGTYIPITDQWYSFDGFENGVRGYFEFINIDRYKNLKGITNPKEYLQTIKNDGYATSLEYVDKVYNVITKWNLTKYDGEQPKEEVKEETKYYRVRLSWEDSKSQLGAYAILDNAKAACKEGYTVYDWNGKEVYSNKKQQQEVANSEYTTGYYKVICNDLNIRKGPGTNYDIVGCIRDKGTYTIVEVQNGHWGRLKSGAGWISIHKNYCTKKGETNENQQNEVTKTNELKVGAKCKIKAGAKTYDNTKSFKSFVYTNTYNIISVNGNRVVFGIGNAVTGATHKDNIILI